MTEKEKMAKGDWYDANHDAYLIKERYQSYDLCHDINQLKPSDPTRYLLFHQLFGEELNNVEIVPPFNCDYGTNIHIGEGTFINMNNYFMDCATISIGKNVFIGPYCGLYCASHPLDYKTRNQGIEKALPITIGDHCWLGANVSVMPGVSIGSGCVIAAGSVVTKDMPENVMIAGVPAKIVKKITQ